MAEKWTTLRELLLPAAAATTRGARGRAVESALREAIRDGRLRPGDRLPSSRDLAHQLNVARGTITAAYAQLVAEGYLRSRRGSGTSVADTLEATSAPESRPAPAERAWRFDLRTGVPALGAFPRTEWISAQRAALAALPDEALGYPDPAGFAGLREELAGYLGRVRAVTARPDQVLVTNGAAEATRLLAEVLHARGHREIAVEDPSHPGHFDLLAAHGLTPVPVPVDDDGIRVDALAETRCRLVLVTAAHQFPLGVVLHPRRRHALLAWARDRDGLVIEDDYDAEHRYDRPALGAMQALDPARVIYAGSVSKVLAPALRLGWLVAPGPCLPALEAQPCLPALEAQPCLPALEAQQGLREALVARKHLSDLGCATLPQAALARLLRTGGYDRHLRRTRALYRRRRDALLDALARRLPAWRPTGVAAGLHLVLRLPEGTDDRAVEGALAERGVRLRALSGYAHGPAGAPFPGLVIGYAALSADRLRAAVDEFATLGEE